jgi:DNA-binding FadR family transcriptional regulator
VALDLHRRLLELSGNRPLLQAGIDLQMRVKLVRLRSGRSPMRARVVIGEHLEIMAAICDRDPDAAAAAAARHLANSLASVVEVLDTSETDQIAGASATAVS